MDKALLPAYLEYLLPMISDHKRELFLRNIASRTRYLTVVLEDLYQAHNASAVLRSCDCFGVQDVHIIENRNKFAVIDDIVLGSAKWLTLRRYRESSHNTVACLQQLREKGYTIVGTTPHEQDTELENMEWEGPVALVFGTEKSGLTPEALAACDRFVKVPMVGFTESLNISVCAAICIHHLAHTLRRSAQPWALSPAEQQELLVEWALQVTGHRRLLEQDFLEKYEKNQRLGP